MANNAIALQARAPNTNFLGAAVRQNAAVINQMAQQQAAQRQAEQQRQAAALAQSKEAREATAADIENARKQIKFYREDVMPAVRNRAGYELVLGSIKQQSPDLEALYRSQLPPETFDSNPEAARSVLIQMTAGIEKNFDAAYPKATMTIGYGANGQPIAITGSSVPGASHYVQVPNATNINPNPAPMSAPTPMAAPTAATPAPTAGAELPATGDPIEAAAQAIVAGKTPRDPAFVNLSNEQFDQAQQRAREIGAQPNPPLQPMSYSPGGQQPDLANIVQTMLDTGVVSQANVDAMRQAAGPGKDAQLAQILREHNIRIMPDEGMPGARMGGGDYDPTRDAAAMQPAQYRVGQVPEIKFRLPTEGQVPGVYNVPPQQIHEKAQAERQTPTEKAAEAEAAKIGEARAATTAQRLQQAEGARNFFITAGVDPFGTVDPVKNLIAGSTSGRIEHLGAEVYGMWPKDWGGGGATQGMKNISTLKTISGKITSDLLGGKLGTGISNEDRNMIQNMLGDIANPDIPAEARIAAWEEVKNIQRRYIQNAPSSGAGKTTRTPTKRRSLDSFRK